MTAVSIGFGLGLALAACLAAYSPTKGLSTACVAMLGVGWAVAVVTAPVAPVVDEVMLSWAALDALFGALCMTIWTRKRHAWLFVLVLLYFAQSFVHVQYWTGNVPTPCLYNYQLWINLLLVAQIWCVAWPGAEHVASRAIDILLPVPRTRDHRRSSRGKAR